MDIEKELKAISDAKTGNKELAVFYNPKGGWSLDVGNPSPFVNLGEVEGEISTGGDSLVEVILKMKKKLGI